LSIKYYSLKTIIIIIERNLLIQIKTTKRINKVKQNGPRNSASPLKSVESNVNNVISSIICAVDKKLEQDEIFYINDK